MADILTEIDATVDGLCACGCETKLDPASRSGWWATEGCQMLWQLARVRPREAEQRRATRERGYQRRLPRTFANAGYHMSAEDAQRVHEQIERGMAEVAEAMRRVSQRLAPVFAEVSRQLAPLIEQMERAGVLDEVEPTDPRERALWLRRNRNTGPKTGKPIPPRRLGAKGGRW